MNRKYPIFKDQTSMIIELFPPSIFEHFSTVYGKYIGKYCFLFTVQPRFMHTVEHSKLSYTETDI